MKATSSPASRDRISCTSAIERMRRTDSSMASFASGDAKRRPCSRSSDEIVCRLFFTRWWISRIVASFDMSSRSRRRSSEMSRVSTTAPDTAPWSRSGMQRISTVTSGPRSNSSVTGAAIENAVRIIESSRPSSPKRSPSALPCEPMRCSADTPFGDVYSTRADGIEEDHAVADAGRLLGLGVLRVEREVAGHDHAGEAVEDVDVGALELARLAPERRAPTPG